MTSRRRWWLIFSAGALCVLAAMLWISTVVLRLEAQTQHQQLMRLALWRMDSWLGVQLREESNRQYFEYLPFYPQERAYTRILNEIEAGEVYSPSPLLTHHSNIFPLHFQLSDTGELTSPQTPTGNWRDLAESSYLQPGVLEQKEELLKRVATLVHRDRFEACVDQAENTFALLLGEESPNEQAQQAPAPNAQVRQQGQIVILPESQAAVQKAISKEDFQRRYNTNMQQQEMNVNDAWMAANQTVASETVEIGALTPLWLNESLLLVRRVKIGEREIFQGILVDWATLRSELLKQLADLFPNARLTPVHQPSDSDVESGRLLGSVPVALECSCPMVAAGPLITPARTTLGLTWLAVLLAVAAAGITLRASVHYGEKRSRFASAVTHELRTPLTTFRMYSEMLAEGMVRDEDQRRTYLNTLKSESNRLATLVENVLSYARLEDGRAVSHAQRTTVGDLLARMRGLLSRRASDANMNLEIVDQTPQNTAVHVDPEVVSQILFNLVDNACKYANGTTQRTIEIDAKIENEHLNIEVVDHGPGIAPEHARRIFAPFDRGAHGPGDTIPGVGLGLALARGLARDLGGDLQLLPHQSNRSANGARFRLTLPMARSS
jgi:signal transduction histidine kinase